MPPEIIPLRIGHCSAPARLSRRGAGWRPIRFPAGAVLIRHPVAGDILFDTGYGPAFFDATRPFPERFYRWLTPVGLPPEQRLPALLRQYDARPRLVLLSHLHADHVAGLFELDQTPPVMTSRIAWEHLHQGGRLATLKAGCPQGLRHQLQKLQPGFIETCAQTPLPEGFAAFASCHDILGDGSVLALPLPGHGYGQFGLLLPETTRGPTFLIADAAWSRAALRDNAPPPDYTLRKLGDARASLATFAALSELMRERPGISLWPSHCPEAFPDPITGVSSGVPS